MSRRETPERFAPIKPRTGRVAGEVSLDGSIDGKEVSRSFAATLVVSADGKTLYALDQGNWRIVILDAANDGAHRVDCDGELIPFGLALSPDGPTALRDQHGAV